MWTVSDLMTVARQSNCVDDIWWSALCQVDLSKVDFSDTFKPPDDSFKGPIPRQHGLGKFLERVGPYIRHLDLHNDSRIRGYESFEDTETMLDYCQFVSGLKLYVPEFPLRHDSLLVTLPLKRLSLQWSAFNRQISDLVNFITTSWPKLESLKLVIRIDSVRDSDTEPDLSMKSFLGLASLEVLKIYFVYRYKEAGLKLKDFGAIFSHGSLKRLDIDRCEIEAQRVHVRNSSLLDIRIYQNTGFRTLQLEDCYGLEILELKSGDPFSCSVVRCPQLKDVILDDKIDEVKIEGCPLVESANIHVPLTMSEIVAMPLLRTLVVSSQNIDTRSLLENIFTFLQHLTVLALFGIKCSASAIEIRSETLTHLDLEGSVFPSILKVTCPSLAELSLGCHDCAKISSKISFLDLSSCQYLRCFSCRPGEIMEPVSYDWLEDILKGNTKLRNIYVLLELCSIVKHSDKDRYVKYIELIGEV
mmetsp:Transcript_27670/g.44992  ORF Transcript_27670/g.44992 Transcript_27670/m.44992 type:complete len:473 (-) Transcript_27670:885-2303(-)